MPRPAAMSGRARVNLGIKSDLLDTPNISGRPAPSLYFMVIVHPHVKNPANRLVDVFHAGVSNMAKSHILDQMKIEGGHLRLLDSHTMVWESSGIDWKGVHLELHLCTRV